MIIENLLFSNKPQLKRCYSIKGLVFLKIFSFSKSCKFWSSFFFLCWWERTFSKGFKFEDPIWLDSGFWPPGYLKLDGPALGSYQTMWHEVGFSRLQNQRDKVSQNGKKCGYTIRPWNFLVIWVGVIAWKCTVR